MAVSIDYADIQRVLPDRFAVDREMRRRIAFDDAVGEHRRFPGIGPDANDQEGLPAHAEDGVVERTALSNMAAVCWTTVSAPAAKAGPSAVQSRNLEA